ncbi:GATA transcription factor 16-like [Andrographis paniculata]|uniref:GATA transcription factor 16-like n=1 Tax=Andrographis paniculata TaxID=175694 RepID=UPI0021E70D24|nr:GATA transcription factor 16-like [Andrographis paniculata]XP_051130550.1 GATA transcription factor 16-like [Andrographis paniculata]
MDLSDKGSDCEGVSSQSPPPDRVSPSGSTVKTCADCGTSKTPLWRGGPDGPKSLCNACGIRSRKKRRALLGVTKEEKKGKKSTSGKNSSSNSGGSSSSSSSGESSSLKKKLWAFGGREDVALQRPRSNTPRRRKLGEVEQAAFLLMALSCGSVYA